VVARSLTILAFPPLPPTPAANTPVNRTAGNRCRFGWPPRAASGYFQRWASQSIDTRPSFESLLPSPSYTKEEICSCLG
jgi:hypothetical protein